MEAREELFMFGSAKCSPGTAPAATGPNYSTRSPRTLPAWDQARPAPGTPNLPGGCRPPASQCPTGAGRSGAGTSPHGPPCQHRPRHMAAPQTRGHGHPEYGPQASQMGVPLLECPGQQHGAGSHAAPRGGPTLALPGAFSSSPRQELDRPRSFLESSASFQPRGKHCCRARAKSQPRGTSRPGRGWPPGADGHTDRSVPRAGSSAAGGDHSCQSRLQPMELNRAQSPPHKPQQTRQHRHKPPKRLLPKPL